MNEERIRDLLNRLEMVEGEIDKEQNYLISLIEDKVELTNKLMAMSEILKEKEGKNEEERFGIYANSPDVGREIWQISCEESVAD